MIDLNDVLKMAAACFDQADSATAICRRAIASNRLIDLSGATNRAATVVLMGYQWVVGTTNDAPSQPQLGPLS